MILVGKPGKPERKIRLRGIGTFGRIVLKVLEINRE
jgi:hypothetical protein